MGQQAPMYTVHDNFISNQHFAEVTTQLYKEAFLELGNPLHIINEFTIINLLKEENIMDFTIYDLHKKITDR